MLLGGDDSSDSRLNHGFVARNSSSSCSSTGNGNGNSKSQLLSLQDESLRTLVQRQSNDLKELLEFSSIEKDCFNRQLCDLKLQNEQYLTKINELLREREIILNSSSDSKVSCDSNSSVVAVSVDSYGNISGEEIDMKHSLDDDGHNTENNNNSNYSSSSSSNSANGSKSNNNSNNNNNSNKNIDMKLREVQAVSGFTCLRDLCLRDLTLMNSDSKRLLAEATRQLGLLDNANHPMSL